MHPGTLPTLQAGLFSLVSPLLLFILGEVPDGLGLNPENPKPEYFQALPSFPISSVALGHWLGSPVLSLHRHKAPAQKGCRENSADRTVR